MEACCNDGNEPALVQNGVSDEQCCWYWDNNEYDLLIDNTVVRSELLDINYDSPIK